MSANSFALTSNITSIPQCGETLFTWQGGGPDYGVSFNIPQIVEANGFQINDQTQTALKTRLPFPAGSQVTGQIQDLSSPRSQTLIFNFVVTDGGDTDCLPSNIPVSNPGNVQIYASPTSDLPSFQVKGLTNGLQLNSCDRIEVDVTSGPPPYNVLLLPEGEVPNLPSITYATNSIVTFPVPYPAGVAFTIMVAGSKFAPNKDFGSQVITILPGSTSCLISGPDGTLPNSASSGPGPSVSGASASSSLSGPVPSSGIGSTSVSASTLVSLSASISSLSVGSSTGSTSLISSPTSVTTAPTNTQTPSNGSTFSRQPMLRVIVSPMVLVTVLWVLL